MGVSDMGFVPSRESSRSGTTKYMDIAEFEGLVIGTIFIVSNNFSNNGDDNNNIRRRRRKRKRKENNE